MFSHICTYTLVWIPIVWIFTHSVENTFVFCGLTLAIHGYTDLASSMYAHKAFIVNKNPRLGFQIVYADQFAHILQLLICWMLFVQ